MFLTQLDKLYQIQKIVWSRKFCSWSKISHSANVLRRQTNQDVWIKWMRLNMSFLDYNILYIVYLLGLNVVWDSLYKLIRNSIICCLNNLIGPIYSRPWTCSKHRLELKIIYQLFKKLKINSHKSCLAWISSSYL